MRAIMHGREMGLFTALYKRYFPKLRSILSADARPTVTRVRPVNINSLSNNVYILLFGCCLALIDLLIELCIGRRKGSKTLLLYEPWTSLLDVFKCSEEETKKALYYGYQIPEPVREQLRQRLRCIRALIANDSSP